jgi:hypothetical protein
MATTGNPLEDGISWRVGLSQHEIGGATMVEPDVHVRLPAEQIGHPQDPRVDGGGVLDSAIDHSPPLTVHEEQAAASVL